MAPEDSDVRNPRRVVGQAAAIITIIYLKIRALNKNTNIPIIVVAVVGWWREDQNDEWCPARGVVVVVSVLGTRGDHLLSACFPLFCSGVYYCRY